MNDRQAIELAVMATTYGNTSRKRTKQIVDDLNRIFPDLEFLLDHNDSGNATVCVMRDQALIGESEGPFEVFRVGKP